MKAQPPFFCALEGQRTNGKQGKCGHTCYFCGPLGPQKRLLGSLPKPGTLGLVVTSYISFTSGQIVPKLTHSAAPPLPSKPQFCGGPSVQSKLSASPSLPLLFLILAPVCHAQQIVNVGLDRHGLPHFLLGGPVLGVQGLFLRRQLAALFF